MTADYDDQLEEPSDEEMCGLHDIPYRPWKGCPACNDEADDRRFESQREERQP